MLTWKKQSFYSTQHCGYKLSPKNGKSGALNGALSKRRIADIWLFIATCHQIITG
jgi:hypothetical protein